MTYGKDERDSHFWISMVKSCVRICAGVALMFGSVVTCGALLVIAEMLGILEEF